MKHILYWEREYGEAQECQEGPKKEPEVCSEIQLQSPGRHHAFHSHLGSPPISSEASEKLVIPSVFQILYI